MPFVHATAVAVAGRGVLLRGPSGSGKSDLALRLIDAGAVLIADDQTIAEPSTGPGPGPLLLSPPPGFAGVMEVRGLPVMTFPHVATVPLCLIVDLVPPDAVVRLPVPHTVELFGQSVPAVALTPFESSAPIKVRLAAAAAAGDNIVFHDK